MREGVIGNAAGLDPGLGRLRISKKLKRRLVRSLYIPAGLGDPTPGLVNAGTALDLALSRDPRRRRIAMMTHRRAQLMARRAPMRRVRAGQLSGLYGDPGLGKLKLGKKLKRVGKALKKVAKSKVFKYAAIATAAYFTGGLALKAAPKLLALGKKIKPGKILQAAQDYQAVRGVQATPDSAAYGYGATQDYGGQDYNYGGGGGSGSGSGSGAMYAGFAPGMSDEEEIDQAEQQRQGGGPLSGIGRIAVPLMIGVPLLMALARSGRGSSRRR